MSPSSIEIAGTCLFALAVLHTFTAKYFERMSKRYPAHSGLLHLLGEIEVLFGFWSLVFILFYCYASSVKGATNYLEGLNFTEPMFVFVIMVVAASKPILDIVRKTILAMSGALPLSRGVAFYWVALSLTPLLGSFITEPAAMTLAALLLKELLFDTGISRKLKYATLAVLLVNVSIGGTLTPYAAPPVLMVASTWQWDLAFMLREFGWKSALAVVINASAATYLFRHELSNIAIQPQFDPRVAPFALTAVHLLFLIAVVVFAHHPVVFMGLFLFFIGIAGAYPRYQERLILREGLLVAFFLAGLVVLGAQQRWWLQPAISDLEPITLFFGAVALTAITDNAALTYLGSLVEGTDAAFRYHLVAGAVAGGGLTVIANAPNPAAFAILQGRFEDGSISALQLFLYALPPTIVACAALLLL
jgi:predicted cation transporter